MSNRLTWKDDADGKIEGERIGREMGEKLGKQLGEIIVKGLEDEYKNGYEQAEKDTIERAFGWLEKALAFGCHSCIGSRLVIEFRKAMEEG